ncbi:hypothetical protein O3Q51_15980 [Cryomorphaceae bacterium 1068]|nr:hypothetical protein [Cryomorphaceae bacterium 1068]
MKAIVTNRIFTIVAVVVFAFSAKAQTSNIGPNQYAFQFTGDPDFGLYFNADDSRYEFLNGSATPIFGFSAGSGQMTTNLQFSPSSDLLIGNNRYAFRAASNPNFGLLFSSTSTEYQFLNNSAEPIFAINANTGRYASDIRFNSGKGVLVDPNTYALRSAVVPDAGFYFGGPDFEIRGLTGAPMMRINTSSGNTVIAGSLKLGDGGLEEEGAIRYVSGEFEGYDGSIWKNLSQIGSGSSLWSQNGADAFYTAGNVGIGTSTPLEKLTLESGEGENAAFGVYRGTKRVAFIGDGSGGGETGTIYLGNNEGITTHRFLANGGANYINAGNLGIGTTSPSAPLDIESENGNMLEVRNPTGGTSYQDFYSGTNGQLTVGLVGGGNGEQVGQAIFWNRKNARLNFGTNNQARMTIRNNGNVGIGTETPNAKFHVIGDAYIDGKVWGREVEVTLASFPDYVFKADYDLMSLSEVDAFIQENGHLPNMPTEAEVVENGLNLGEMNVKLVEKVEELTLHLIEKEKQYEALQSRLEMLEKAILNQD